MKNKVNLSILIISYNTKKITKNCLQSLFESLKGTKITFEVIVLDNQSKDGSLAMLEKLSHYYKQLIAIKSDQNLGFAKGNNLLVKKARGKYLLFLNSDIIVLDRAVEKLYQYYLANEKEMNFLGGKLYNKNMTEQFSCGPFYSLLVIFGALFLRGDYWGLTRYSPNKIKKVDWVSGACFITNKQSFQKIGGFDEKIFMYMEDLDLNRRLHKDYKTMFYPYVSIVHIHAKESYKRKNLLRAHIKSTVYYFNKWGWFFDSERREINRELLKRIEDR